MAALVLGVLGFAAASSASAAAPEFGRCVKVAKGTGSFTTGSCTTAGAGSFEWLSGPGPNNHFTLAPYEVRKPDALLAEGRTTGHVFACTTVDESGGEVSSATTVSNVTLRFNNCEFTVNCENRNIGFEEVEATGLTGTLGVISKGETAQKNKIGLDFSTVNLSYTCDGGAIPVEWRGSVILPVPANSMKLSEPLKFTSTGKAGTKYKQKPEQLEGEAPDVLEWSVNLNPFEQFGMELSLLLTNEEKLEVNSVV
jgi:hypothetical protein